MENINMNNISITSTLQQQHQHQQPQANAMTESTLNNSNRKLYFKQSATEALHSAILLKARNPSVSQQQILQQQQQQQLQQQQSIIKSCDTGSNNRILLLNAKWPNQINNLATISSSNSCNTNSTMPPVINLTDENQSQQITSSHITVAPIAIDSAGSMVGNANYSDELDSPFKIKENILTSIRNLKPVLAGLSSSTSDEDEDELNNNNNNNNNSNNNNVNIISNSVNEIQEINYQPNDIILYSSSSPSMPSSSSSILPNVVNNSNGIVKLTIATNNLIPRHNYLRTNTTTYAKLNTPTNANSIGNNNPTSTTPKLPSAFNEMKLSFNNNNSTQLQSLQQQQIQSITVTPPIILNKTASSTTNSSSSSLLLTKTQLNRITSVSSKRGKDEALSNSSSSDEETEHQHRNQQQQQQRVNNTNQSNNQKLQLILNNGNSLKSLMSNKQTNLLTITQQQQQPSQSQQQPYITPVVSAASVAAAAAAAASSSTAHQSSINYTTESDLINSPSSMSSNKSESDYGSLINSNLSFSISSPTSCCSSSNSSSCTTNDSSSAIDLNDDNSSTASGPIYVRQPGFEFHAHEVQQQQQQQQQQMLVAQTSEQQQQQPTKPLLKSLNRSNKKQDDSTTVCGSKSSNTQKNTKAKKKLCMMLIADPMSSKEETKANSIQLKPISNKAKRDPLPMRLRALPPSFWQQPNQPSASLTSTMYLPPLFKNDIIESVLDSAESSTNANCYYDEDYSGTTGTGKIGMFDSCQTNYREVRISPANTDLLFKLFDNIEQKDSKKQMQLQFKSHRLNTKQPLKGLSKALIRNEDPCIVDAVTEGLFPLLRLDSRNETVQLLSLTKQTNDCLINNLNSNGLSSSSPALSSSSIATTSIANSCNNLNAINSTLPSIQFEQNYSQVLSEVVAAL